MSSLIRNFTFDRNAVLRTPEASADKANETIEVVARQTPLDKTASNKVGAFASYMGLFRKEGNEYVTTALADNFQQLYNQNKGDAWRWLLTRSLWLYVVPNGTQAAINRPAQTLGISFNFFRLIVRTLSLLQAQPNEQRYLYYDEFCVVMDEDDNWRLDAFELTAKILAARILPLDLGSKPGFLEELETSYSLSRDNYNGLFNKLFEQTGLFEYVTNGAKRIGIALNKSVNDVLQRRLRFVIDHPPAWDGTTPWPTYLSDRTPDLPLEVTDTHEEPPLVVTMENLSSLVSDVTQALNDAGLRVSLELVKRYLSSLLTKRFVVLSGLTGSGKTKLAQLVAQWLDSPTPSDAEAFVLGESVGLGTATYTVTAVSPSWIEVANSEGELTPLPMRIIAEWADYIRERGLSWGDEGAKAETIRTEVKRTSTYANYIHGSASVLKALAFHLLNRAPATHRRYEVVPVEANWTSPDDVFGYADALDNRRFARRPALDLVLHARASYENSPSPLPYFLILDEMNLSHVERYFATILSALESGEAITLHGDAHDRDGVPPKLLLPPNLFIIGTINVDETTYQFSPKVLDRANVIEFRVSDAQMLGFLQQPAGINSASLAGQGAGYAAAFVAAPKTAPEPGAAEIALLEDEVMLFYEAMASQGAEFGFRTAREIARFIRMHTVLGNGTPNFQAALDAQVLQKLLPKLHGSQRKLEPLLRSLAVLCHETRGWQVEPKPADAAELRARLLADMHAAANTRNKDLDPLSARKKEDGEPRFAIGTAYLPMSFEKLIRMLERVARDGFTSFAEA